MTPSQFILRLAIHRAYSYIFHPCSLLPHFPLLQIPPLQLCPCRIFHSRIFSRPTGERTEVPNFTFIGAVMLEYCSQNCQNFEFWPEIFASGVTRLHNFYEILRFCTHLLVAFKFSNWTLSNDKQPSYKHFQRWGNFSTNFH